MKKIIGKLALLISLSLSTPILSDTASKVDSWFNNMNYSNVTNPGVYKGQSAGYATLGGVSTRAPITQPFNFVNVQTPKLSAGCGGIDFYAGGFSAIDSDKFIENMRAIGQNAQSLAFMLAIQIVSPQLSGVMEKIQTYANDYLNKNISSCEVATQMVGGSMELFGAKKGNCTVKRMQDFGEDYTTANYACTNGGKRRETDNSGGDANKVSFVKGNLAWYVLMEDPFFKADPQFAEVIMNLTGTIIIADANNDEDSPSVISKLEPAMFNDTKKSKFENIYTALLTGKSATDKLQIFRCSGGAGANKDGCDKLTDQIQVITPSWTGLYNRINTLLVDIVRRIYEDQALSSEQMGLIASTSIPLYKYLTVVAAAHPRSINTGGIFKKYSKLIAEDILIRSMQSVVEVVEQRSSNLKNGMGDSKEIRKYRSDLKKLISGFAKIRVQNELLAGDYQKFMREIRTYEKMLMAKLSTGFLTGAAWGK